MYLLCSTMERTYIMIKPDGVQRNLVGEIIARFEKKGYKLAALKVGTTSSGLRNYSSSTSSRVRLRVGHAPKPLADPLLTG